MSFLTWHSLVFLIPIALSAALLVGSALGLDTHDVDDADLDPDLAADGDLEPELEADLDADANPEVSLSSLLGVGRVPLSLLVTTLLLSFGGIGLTVEYLLAAHLPIGVAAWIALGVSTALAPVTTGLSARVLARWIPTTETYATTAWDLIGSVGVVEIGIDDHFGIATVVDSGGAQIKIRCHSQTGPIARGERALVIDYEASKHEYLVEKEPVYCGLKEITS